MQVGIQDIISWETVKESDIFRLSVKEGALKSNPGFNGTLDFGTADAEAIKAVLLDVAKELATKKRAARADKREADRVAADAAAKLAMRLEDTVSEQYIGLHDKLLISKTDLVRSRSQ
jgi:hypothetical protein